MLRWCILWPIVTSSGYANYGEQIAKGLYDVHAVEKEEEKELFIAFKSGGGSDAVM